jgi:hypothetical protein
MEVAKIVWEAYNSDKLHWYVPEEIGELDKAAGNNPELVREQISQMMAAMGAAQDEPAKK